MPVGISFYQIVCLRLKRNNYLLINITLKPYTIPLFSLQPTVLSIGFFSCPGQNKCLPIVLQLNEKRKKYFQFIYLFLF